MTKPFLVVDTREREVIPLIEALFGAAGVPHVVKQINTGDYLICRAVADATPPKVQVLACIERKSLKDYGSSIRDGRMDNREKMLKLREESGCALFYFIEGPAFPRLEREFARVPYRTILNSMTRMTLRYGVHIERTENTAHTAQRLLDYTQQIGEEVHGGAPEPVVALEAEPGRLHGATAGALETAAVPAAVMGRVVKSDEDQVRAIWCRLPGVQTTTAQILMNNMTPYEFVRRLKDHTGLRSPANRPLCKRALASLHEVLRGSKDYEAKLLSGVEGLGLPKARALLKGRSLAALLSFSQEALAIFKVPRGGKETALGPKLAARIHSLMGCPPEDGDAPPKGDAAS